MFWRAVGPSHPRGEQPSPAEPRALVAESNKSLKKPRHMPTCKPNIIFMPDDFRAVKNAATLSYSSQYCTPDKEFEDFQKWFLLPLTMALYDQRGELLMNLWLG